MEKMLLGFIPLVIVIAIFYFLVRSLLSPLYRKVGRKSAQAETEILEKCNQMFHAVDDVAAETRKITSRLDVIDARVAGIEKTLSEIPS